MKKTIAAGLTSLALLAGPTVVAGPANAADYVNGKFATTSSQAKMIDPVINQRKHPFVKWNVKSLGNAPEPTGIVRFRIIRPSGVVAKTVERRYHQDGGTYTMPRLRGTKDGRTFTIRLRFRSNRFQAQYSSTHVTVKR